MMRASRLVPVALIALAAASALAWALMARHPRAEPPVDAAALRREAARTNDPEALLAVGERLRRAGEGEAAFDAISRAYDRHPKEPRYSAAMAGILLEGGQVQAAVALATEELGRAPKSADLNAVAAEGMRRSGRYDRALALARTAVRLGPESPLAWRAFALACSANRLLAEVWPAFERALQLAPDDAGLMVDYGQALGRFGRAAEAERVLREAVRLRPSDPRALTQLGTHLGQRARSTEARREAMGMLRRAVALAPGDPESHYQLGRALLAGGDAQEAAAALEECLRLDRSFGDAWQPLAQAYRALGRSADARLAFEQQERFTDYRREAAHLELRLRRRPGSVDLLRRMAALQERYGRWAQAARYYQEAVRLRPDPELDRRLRRLRARDSAPG